MSRHQKHQGKEHKDSPYVIGVRATLEVLHAKPEEIQEVWVSEKGSHRQEEELASQKGIVCKTVQEDVLDRISGGANHQGVALLLRERSYYTIQDIVAEAEGKDESLVIAVDELYDPQNFGSVLRAAECFGASGVIWSRNRGVAVTPAVTKVSAGASELVPLVPVSNLRSALLTLKEADFWVHATALGERSQSIHGYEFPGRSVLVLGSEGKGVQPLIQKEADILLEIPMLGQIDSLNVAQAAAVTMAAYRAGLSKS